GDRQNVYFFSRRRRHTIWPRDWSSDVCSSDLRETAIHWSALAGWWLPKVSPAQWIRIRPGPTGNKPLIPESNAAHRLDAERLGEIGRASGRERVEGEVVGGGLEEIRAERTER